MAAFATIGGGTVPLKVVLIQGCHAVWGLLLPSTSSTPFTNEGRLDKAVNQFFRSEVKSKICKEKYKNKDKLYSNCHFKIGKELLPGIPEVKTFSASGVWNNGYKSLQTAISKAEVVPERYDFT